MARRRRPIRYYSKKRRAIYAQGDEINHLELFEKFNWVCGICGDKINKRLRFPHYWAATVDHIIPISRGGTHTWDNVRPAHAKCNFDRGNSTIDLPQGIMVA